MLVKLSYQHKANLLMSHQPTKRLPLSLSLWLTLKANNRLTKCLITATSLVPANTWLALICVMMLQVSGLDPSVMMPLVPKTKHSNFTSGLKTTSQS